MAPPHLYLLVLCICVCIGLCISGDVPCQVVPPAEEQALENEYRKVGYAMKSHRGAVITATTDSLSMMDAANMAVADANSTYVNETERRQQLHRQLDSLLEAKVNQSGYVGGLKQRADIAEQNFTSRINTADATLRWCDDTVTQSGELMGNMRERVQAVNATADGKDAKSIEQDGRKETIALYGRRKLKFQVFSPVPTCRRHDSCYVCTNGSVTVQCVDGLGDRRPMNDCVTHHALMPAILRGVQVDLMDMEVSLVLGNGSECCLHRRGVHDCRCLEYGYEDADFCSDCKQGFAGGRCEYTCGSRGSFADQQAGNYTCMCEEGWGEDSRCQYRHSAMSISHSGFQNSSSVSRRMWAAGAVLSPSAKSVAVLDVVEYDNRSKVETAVVVGQWGNGSVDLGNATIRRLPLNASSIGATSTCNMTGADVRVLSYSDDSSTIVVTISCIGAGHHDVYVLQKNDSDSSFYLQQILNYNNLHSGAASAGDGIGTGKAGITGDGSFIFVAPPGLGMIEAWKRESGVYVRDSGRDVRQPSNSTGPVVGGSGVSVSSDGSSVASLCYGRLSNSSNVTDVSLCIWSWDEDQGCYSLGSPIVDLGEVNMGNISLLEGMVPSVSEDGKVVVVGVPERSDGGSAGEGEVVVVRWDEANSIYVLHSTLTSPLHSPGSHLGFASVSLDGTTILAGAPAYPPDGSGVGAAFVWRWEVTEYVYKEKLSHESRYGQAVPLLSPSLSSDGKVVCLATPSLDVSIFEYDYY
mmetsp:Transcript_7603/g.19702  ORF Transcript_7603/g.19702 Transcript_7603/m.19702 type:complete len:751 (-) Transcript_7603:219-2471(-)